jgi:hypothetical protein
MAWLWNSWEEYVDIVHPVALDSPGRVRLTQQSSWFEMECHLWKAVEELKDNVQSLRELGFTGSDHDRPPSDPSIIDKAAPLVLEAVYAAEELLLYHKRLAKSDAAYGFFHQNDVLEHWDRYAKTGRIAKEIHQLMSDIDKLLQGYRELVQGEDRFIVGDLDLPSSLAADFRLARNLFSVGFDEVGLLIAGRGLEGVLRRIAEVRKISLVIKGKSSPASEAGLHDLIETMFQVRWKAKGTRLVTLETKALLHYLRTLRNSGAHAIRGKKSVVNPRETAAVVAATANQLWNEVANTRTRLDPTTVQKTWG